MDLLLSIILLYSKSIVEKATICRKETIFKTSGTSKQKVIEILLIVHF